MRISQFFFTKQLYKNNESAYSSKNPSNFASTQLSSYYFWWGYQNFFKKPNPIVSGVSFTADKTLYIYQL